MQMIISEARHSHNGTLEAVSAIQAKSAEHARMLIEVLAAKETDAKKQSSLVEQLGELSAGAAALTQVRDELNANAPQEEQTPGGLASFATEQFVGNLIKSFMPREEPRPQPTRTRGSAPMNGHRQAGAAIPEAN